MSKWKTTLTEEFPDIRGGAAKFEGSTELGARGKKISRAQAIFLGQTALSAVGKKLGRAGALFAGSTALASLGHKLMRKSTSFQGATALAATGRVLLPTIYHIIMTGQSNMAGTGGGLGATSVAIPKARKFVGGERPGNIGLGSMVVYTANDSTTDGQSVAETMGEFLGNHIPGNAIFLFSNVAFGGAAYGNIKKGTGPYNQSLSQMIAARVLAAAAGITYRILAVTLIHGEQDMVLGNTGDYAAHMQEFYADYNADIQAINPGNAVVRLHMAQVNSIVTPADAGPTDATRRMYEISVSDPDKFTVMARYHCEHYDNLHLSCAGQRKLGEQFGRIIYQKEFLGTWSPFKVVSAVRTGTNIVVTFELAHPPIRFDFTETAWGGFNGWFDGFVYDDSTHSSAISSIAITGAKEITLGLTLTPTGSSPRLKYGCDPVPFVGAFNDQHKLGGSHGCLFDSDPMAASCRYTTLTNPCPQFDVAVTT